MSKAPKHILVLTYWSYKEALIQSYTLPYVRLMLKVMPEGSRVTLLTLEKADYPVNEDEQVKIRKELHEEGIHWLDSPYIPFSPKALLGWIFLFNRLKKWCRKEKVTHLHAWCTPAGGAGYVLKRLTGLPLTIDSYEPHAESMVENGTWTKSSPAYKILFYLEKQQSRKASHFIGLTKGMRKYAKSRYGVEPSSYFVKPAAVDLDRFDPKEAQDEALRKELGLEEKLVGVYAGKLGGIYLTKETFEIFHAAWKHWGDRFRALLLTDADPAMIKQYSREMGLPEGVVIDRHVPFADIHRYMGLADFAINPVKPVPSKRYCTSIKDGEYWAMGLPVVIPAGISDDSDIIRERKIGAVLETLEPSAYQQAMRDLDELWTTIGQNQLRQKIRATAEGFRHFSVAEEIYRKIYG